MLAREMFEPQVMFQSMTLQLPCPHGLAGPFCATDPAFSWHHQNPMSSVGVLKTEKRPSNQHDIGPF